MVFLWLLVSFLILAKTAGKRKEIGYFGENWQIKKETTKEKCCTFGKEYAVFVRFSPNQRQNIAK